MNNQKTVQKLIEKYTLFSLGFIFILPIIVLIITSSNHNSIHLGFNEIMNHPFVYSIKFIFYYLTIRQISRITGEKLFNDKKSSLPVIILSFLCIWGLFLFISFISDSILKSLSTDFTLENLQYNFVMWLIFGFPVIIFATLTQGVVTGIIIHKKLKKRLFEIHSQAVIDDIHNNELVNYIENLEKNKNTFL